MTESIYFRGLFITHMFVIAPFLIYLGIVNKDLPKMIYPILWYLSLIIIGYHSYRYVTKGLHQPLWNILHIFVLAILLLTISYKQVQTPKIIWDLMIGFGGMAFAINMWFLFSH